MSNFKKKISATLLTLFFSCILPSVFAADQITVTINDAPVYFDVAPQIINNRTMVPMRAIFEQLGATVTWNDSTKTVTAKKGSTTVLATIASPEIKVNNKTKVIDTAPIIVDSRTLVPVRFVSESLGYAVEWDAENKRVLIKNGLEVHFIDVGQADSALLISADAAMLIDGGNKADGTLVVDYLKSQNIDSLDFVVCTHGHEDHVGGLPYILENISADTVIVNDDYDSAIFESFIKTATEKNIPIKAPKPGEKLDLGLSQITFLAPVHLNYSDYNDNSIVLRVDHLDSSFLFTGDAGIEAENDILSSNAYIDVDVLKVGHHGSRTASSNSFLNKTSPDYAIISCGTGNSYGHPHQETLASLYANGIITYRTDEYSDIKASSDGENIHFTFGKSSPLPSITLQGSEQTNTYIGNKNSKKLHLPTCSSLPNENNRKYFSDISQAISEGYEACKNCNPR